MISDEAIYQKKRHFELALLDLMEKMPYSQITVVNLIEKVAVSRKTFYRYYPDKDACLNSLIRWVIRDSALYTTEHATKNMTLRESYTIQLCFWRSQQRFLTVLVRNDLIYILQQGIMEHARAEEKDILRGLCAANGEFDDDCLFFFASGMCRMLTNWCNNGFETPIEEIAKKLDRLFHQPLIPVGSDRLSVE